MKFLLPLDRFLNGMEQVAPRDHLQIHQMSRSISSCSFPPVLKTLRETWYTDTIYRHIWILNNSFFFLLFCFPVYFREFLVCVSDTFADLPLRQIHVCFRSSVLGLICKNCGDNFENQDLVQWFQECVFFCLALEESLLRCWQFLSYIITSIRRALQDHQRAKSMCPGFTDPGTASSCRARW